jgi:type II secretory pathway component GspD/PulD (secretin)
MALAPAGVRAQAPLPVETPATSDGGQTRPARVHNALRMGTDAYRRGDYELAATYLQQAQAGQEDLTKEERQTLKTWLQLNGTALQARREGASQLHQAELALKQGRNPDAAALLKAVTPNQQYLSPGDRQRFQQITERMVPATANVPTAAVAHDETDKARTKLKQARIFLSRGNYDVATALANEAAKMNAVYTVEEDNPVKILDDIQKARAAATKPGDAKSLLIAARSALSRGQLDEAERLANSAERAKGIFDFPPWSDNPSKVRKEILAARSRLIVEQSALKPAAGQVTASVGVTTPAATASVTVVDNTEAARKLMKQARAAFVAGNISQAKILAEKAKALKPAFNYWEDNPDKLFVDIQQVEATKQAKGSKDGSANNQPAVDPHLMVKQARQLYDAGKLDEAEKLALKANAVPNAHWGLFDFDSPERLLTDIHKAKFKRDQEESVRVLAQARVEFGKGNYKEAERLAHRAEVLHHGPYSLWELGDRPQKLLVEIDAARMKDKQKQLPPAPGMVAKDDGKIQIVPSTAAPAPDATWPPKPTTTSSVAQVPTTPPLTIPQTPSASVTTTVPTLPPLPNASASVTIPPLPDYKPAMSSQPATAVVGWGQDESRKRRAQALLVEARQLQSEGRLIEARQKAQEAQSIGASFGANEDRPELVMLAISAVCQKRIDTLVQQASEDAAVGSREPSHYQRAEFELKQARQLAMAFGFDTKGIDVRMSWLQQSQTKATASNNMPAVPLPFAATQPQTAQAVTGVARGQSLLNEARMELRAGQTTNARRLAETAFDPQYGVQTEAAKVLRSIDAEEYNQRVLAANRTFDAGVAAFSRREFAQAGTIFRGLDTQLLAPDKQARLSELMLAPELQVKAVVQMGMQTPAPTNMSGAGQARVTDNGMSQPMSPNADFAQQVKAMEEVKFQKLGTDGLQAQTDATKSFGAGETDRALEILQEYQITVKTSGLGSEKVALLCRPIDERLARLKMLKHQRDFEKLQLAQTEKSKQAVSQRFQAEEDKKKQMAELMKQYNTLFKEGKYLEAQKYAMLAHELDPDDPRASAAVYVAEMKANVTEYKQFKSDRDKMVLHSLNDAEREGRFVNMDQPLAYDEKVSELNKGRKGLDPFKIGVIKTEKEKQIYRQLDAPIASWDYHDMPLKQILDDLQVATGLNIVPDAPALNEQGITLERPITMKLEGIALKSALNLLLRQAHLTHVVRDEALVITTEENARGKLETKIYPVTDLVIPVNNAPSFDTSDPLRRMAQQTANPNLKLNNVAPWLGSNSLGNGKDLTPYANGGANSPGMNGNAHSAKDDNKGTIEEALMRLVTNCIAPQSWDSVGGHGHIDYYPLGQALVVNQTPDIQEQVAELLKALRQLQDQEVAVEIRFITIAEGFYERIGVDFNINIRNNNSRYSSQLVSQQFQPFGFINNFSPNNFITGLTPGGTFTQDLGIPLTNSSFGMAVPPFGGFPNAPGANGGLSLGLAFLSDIEVDLFMEAAQGDQRTNVMQAPKLTLFNGQTSTLQVDDQQFFVTQVSVVQAGGQVVFVPVNTQMQTGGVTLTINAVISADRRFVRLSLTPQLTNLASAIVPLFPITTFITPIFEGGAVGQPVPFTQYLQQPVFNTIQVQTTVNVPDGGTVLMGGLKRLSEGRNEYGPPILSKIPYLDRLFKNTAYGRDTESLLMMVTPRVIINEEEEQRQVPSAVQQPTGQ